MTEVDHLPFVRQRLAAIVSARDSLEREVATYPTPGVGPPPVHHELLTLVNAADDLVGLIERFRESTDFEELADDLTIAKDSKLRISNPEQPTWDFLPWYTEKTTRIKKATKDLIRLLETDPESLPVAPGAQITAHEYLRSSIHLALGEIGHCAASLGELAESGQLTLRDIVTRRALIR